MAWAGPVPGLRTDDEMSWQSVEQCDVVLSYQKIERTLQQPKTSILFVGTYIASGKFPCHFNYIRLWSLIDG